LCKHLVNQQAAPLATSVVPQKFQVAFFTK
jgi:hypothetical protein